jgi:hypothetical protein
LLEEVATTRHTIPPSDGRQLFVYSGGPHNHLCIFSSCRQNATDIWPVHLVQNLRCQPVQGGGTGLRFVQRVGGAMEPPPLESHCGRALSAAGHGEVEASEHTDYLCDLG